MLLTKIYCSLYPGEISATFQQYCTDKRMRTDTHTHTQTHTYTFKTHFDEFYAIFSYSASLVFEATGYQLRYIAANRTPGEICNIYLSAIL